MFGKRKAEEIGEAARELVEQIAADLKAGRTAETTAKVLVVWRLLNRLPFGAGPQSVVTVLRAHIRLKELAKDSDKITDAERATMDNTIQAWFLVWSVNPKAVALAPELKPTLDALRTA